MVRGPADHMLTSEVTKNGNRRKGEPSDEIATERPCAEKSESKAKMYNRMLILATRWADKGNRQPDGKKSAVVKIVSRLTYFENGPTRPRSQ